MRWRQVGKDIIGRMKEASSQRIASLYLLTFGLFMLVGAFAALTMQLELWNAASKLFSGQLFGHLLTQHGMVMTFVVLIPIIPAVLGNLIIPSAVGARDMAIRKLNAVGWLMHLFGGVAIVVAIELGAYDTGWTMKMPPSASGIFQLLMVGLGSVAVSAFVVNFAIARTILSRKHRTLPASQLPVLAWFFLIGALVVVVVTPIRLFTLTLQSLHQIGYIPVFSLLDADGLIRYQRLFWAYTEPATYAAVLPALGVTFEVLTARAGTALFARRAVIFAGVMLGQLSLVSWGRHLLIATNAGQLAVAGSLFSLLSAVPMSLILLSWLVMLSRLRSWRSAPIIITCFQTALLTLGGTAGIVLAVPSTGLTFLNSYVSTGHLHLLALGGVILSLLAGLFHWWPEIPQKPIPVSAGRAVAVAVAAGIIATYLPMILNGLAGSPNALHVYPSQFEMMHMVSTGGAVILFAGFLGAIWLFARSALGGRLPSDAEPSGFRGEVAFSNARNPSLQEESR